MDILVREIKNCPSTNAVLLISGFPRNVEQIHHFEKKVFSNQYQTPLYTLYSIVDHI